MNNFILCRNYSIISSFIPRYAPVDNLLIKELQHRLDDVPKILILTGAGVSTESGIPDYRSEKVGRFATSKNRPVQFTEFLKNAEIRRRYWARNYVGWATFSKFEPNIVHHTLSNWELSSPDRMLWLITQNVDNLHRKAGNRRITELHGSAFRVHCLKCNFSADRHSFQQRLANSNPNIDTNLVSIAPDGDVDLSDELIASFVPPLCPKCKSDLVKPNIVFFGDNVDKDTVEFCYDKVDTADGMLVLGSSLHVYSGFRFVKRMVDRSRPVFMINIGPTRADQYATLKLNAKCGEVVPLLKVSKIDPLLLPQMVNRND